MGFKGFDRMKNAMDKVQDLQDKAPTQEDYEKAWENAKKNPKSAPKFIDGMPPKETSDVKKGLEQGLKAMDGKGLGKALGMKKGGMVKSSASKRADGCAIRGKTKGRIV